MNNFTCVLHAAAYRRRLSVALFLMVILMITETTVNGQTKIIKEPSADGVAPLPAAKPPQQLSYEIIPAAQNSFGYNIISGTKKLVHQPSVPGLPGNRGFNSKEDAEKCAKLVIKKINNNIMPPTVTRQELDSLNIKL